MNHSIALLNKLFQAVQAGVPVVAADLPELRRVVTGHSLGTLYTPGDVASLIDALRKCVESHGAYVEAVRAAAPALAWSVDRARLLAVYDSFGGPGRAQTA